ncbi:MAG: hypothetical protein ACTSRG_11035 [Candidatus Helarchaeota archaeon]
MSDQAALEKIGDDIGSKIGTLIGVRVYSAIADPNGKILTYQDGISPFINLIENFVLTNFPYLKFGDHSIPLSGHNLIFFRTNRAVLALYSPKGKYGQLLSFKAQFNSYASQIDDLIGEVTYNKEIVTKKIVEKAIPELKFSRDRWQIIPIFSVKLTGKEKLPIDEATILNSCDGNTTIQKLAETNQENIQNIIDTLLKYYHKGWIRFPNFYPITVNCPVCKTKIHLFIPKIVYELNPSNYIRLQIPPERCDHTFTVFIDKDMKTKTQKLEHFRTFIDEIDFFNLSIENLIEFFGQNLVSNIFYTLLLKKSVIFIEKEKKTEMMTEYIAQFLKKIFPNLEYGVNIKGLSREEYKKNWKKCKDSLIVELSSNIVINEPFKQEKFEVIVEILKESLKEENEKQEILKLNHEVERLLLLTEPVISIAENSKKIIVEAELVEKIREEYNLELRIEEIPLVKELTKAYYNKDISRKIVSELAYSIW